MRVEAPDLSRAVWHKSSRSQPTQSDCVEIARLAQTLFVRDSKNPDGEVLTFAIADWTAFTEGVKRAHPVASQRRLKGHRA